METVFRINASSLDNQFLLAIKALFKKREIEIVITDTPSDDTSLLLSDPLNKAHLLGAIEEVRKNKNLVRFTGEEFKKYSKNLCKFKLNSD